LTRIPKQKARPHEKVINDVTNSLNNEEVCKPGLQYKHTCIGLQDCFIASEIYVP